MELCFNRPTSSSTCFGSWTPIVRSVLPRPEPPPSRDSCHEFRAPGSARFSTDPPWRGRPPQRMRSLHQHGRPTLRADHGGGGGSKEHSATTSCGNDKLCDVILEEISRVRHGRLAGQRSRRRVRGGHRCGRYCGTALQTLATHSRTALPLAPGKTTEMDSSPIPLHIQRFFWVRDGSK